jgi:hypothetical protein
MINDLKTAVGISDLGSKVSRVPRGVPPKLSVPSHDIPDEIVIEVPRNP